MTGNRSYFTYKDVIPFAAMVTMECTNVGLNTLYKAATLRGMSYHVFVVYSYGVAAFLLLPAPFLSNRSRVLPPVNISIVSKIGLLGIIGCTSQIMGYTGIIYSSPTLASAISNLVPAFTFIFAVIFRMETLSFSKKSCRAKLVGTIVSVTGAFVVTLYKGPIIIWGQLSSSSNAPSVSLGTSQPNWALGGLFLTSEYILVPLWYIVQIDELLKQRNEIHASYTTAPPTKRSGSSGHRIKRRGASKQPKEDGHEKPSSGDRVRKKKWFNIHVKVDKRKPC